MPLPTEKTKIKQLSDDVNLDFYCPKKALAKYGWSQRALAEKLNVSVGTISSLVRGNPNIAQLKVLADAMGCSFFEFFETPEPGEGLSDGDFRCPRCNSILSVSLK